VNGNQITAFSAASYPPQNSVTVANSANAQRIGSYITGSQYFDGYMTDINFVDGQQLEPYYFGNNDAYGNWKPIKYTGMYGTNGFYLTFGNTTSTTTLGYDSSGNNNNWTTNNISLTAGVTYDAMTDVPTNTSATVANYCTWNPLNSFGSAATISNGNLNIVTPTANGGTTLGTMAVTSGKWYWEVTPSVQATFIQMGIVSTTIALAAYLESMSTSLYFISGNKGTGPSGTIVAYGSTITNGDVVGIALDMDAGTLEFYKNGVSMGVAFTGISGTYAPAIGDSANTISTTSAVNFGQRPFSYTAPSGFVALNTYNLPTPTILQGNKYMDATTYTGNGSTQVIVNNAQFKSDFVWVKSRSAAENNVVFDSVRGVTNYLLPNSTVSEQNYGTFGVTAFNSNGFTVIGGSGYAVNTSAATYVGWQWQAGQGTNTSNTSGSITSTVSVNTTAGFSVVTYTGNGTAGATVGHGLGVTPAMIIVKARSAGGANYEWVVQHKSVSASQILLLSNTIAATTSATFNSQYPSSSVIYLGSNTGANQSTITYVAYCWAAIAGFSAFGSYTGNGSADGPFVFTNFQPKFVMIKRTDSTGSWFMVDTSRNTYNLTDLSLYANLSDAEGASASHCIDILSNGFKCKGVGTNINASGGTYIYAAFASNPFKNSNAR
jgi:hypothetical protein